MKAYTEHKLTDSMLVRLSGVCKTDGRPHKHGNSLIALEDRGLVEEIPGGRYPRTHRPTEAGQAALARARAEGW